MDYCPSAGNSSIELVGIIFAKNIRRRNTLIHIVCSFLCIVHDKPRAEVKHAPRLEYNQRSGELSNPRRNSRGAKDFNQPLLENKRK
jgi:hypothetical protein